MKQDWVSDRQAVVLTSETPWDCFLLGKLYGALPALQKDCLEGGMHPGDFIRLTVPATYMITFITSQKL